MFETPFDYLVIFFLPGPLGRGSSPFDRAEWLMYALDLKISQTKPPFDRYIFPSIQMYVGVWVHWFKYFSDSSCSSSVDYLFSIKTHPTRYIGVSVSFYLLWQYFCDWLFVYSSREQLPVRMYDPCNIIGSTFCWNGFWTIRLLNPKSSYFHSLCCNIIHCIPASRPRYFSSGSTSVSPKIVVHAEYGAP